MGESAVHTALVRKIIERVRERYPMNQADLYIFRDTPDNRPGDRPRAINGFVPDVFAGTIPHSFSLIGEAKCAVDLGTQRTENQLRTFIRHLARETDPVLIIATPPTLNRAARSLVYRLIEAEHALLVNVEFLTST